MSEPKTEEPTPRREQKARRDGSAWQSRDLTLGATLAAAGGLTRLGASDAPTGLEALFERSIALASAGEFAPRSAIEEALTRGAASALPLLATILLVGAAASALQVRGLFALSALAPDVARLDPSVRSGTGPRALTTLFANAARLALVALVSVATIAEVMPGVATLARQAPSAALEAGLVIASTLALRVGLALAAFGVLDAVIERGLFRASLKMSRRDIDRERREAEGDAHVRMERDRVRRELRDAATRDELAAAALVVVDAELAVVLAYDETDPDAVPRVVAAERSTSADDLVREARALGVPCVVDAELALALAIVPLGAAIPEALYDRVAAALLRGGARTS